MRILLSMLIALAAAMPLAAQDRIDPADVPYAYRQLPDKGAEAAAAALMETVRCIQCQGQSIADSDAPIAAAMRHEVRTQIASGKSPEEVREWLVARYGEWVSYDPGFDLLSAPLYIVPILMLLFGGWLAWRRFGRRRVAEGAR